MLFRFSIDYKSYSITYLDSQNHFNYTANYIDVPLNLTVTIVMITCYSVIFIYLRLQKVAHNLINPKDIKIAVQFGIASGVYISKYCQIALQ